MMLEEMKPIRFCVWRTNCCSKYNGNYIIHYGNNSEWRPYSQHQY